MDTKILLLFMVVFISVSVTLGFVSKNNKKQDEIQSNINSENQINNKVTDNNEEQINNTVIDNTENQISNIVTNNTEKNEVVQMDTIQIKVKDKVLKVKLEKNSSVDAFVEKLKEGDIVVEAHEYGGFEKVGELDFSLPREDTSITTSAGDIVLYQGNQISLFYNSNSWSYTKLGKIQNIDSDELKNILGDGDVSLTFTLIQ